MIVNKEIIVKNSDEFVKKFQEIKAEETSDKVFDIHIVFDKSLDKETFLSSLNSVLEAEESVIKYAAGEQEFEQNYIFNIELKQISKDYKLDMFKMFLKRETVLNSKIILNIYNLIKTYNSFEDAFFVHPDVYFNTLEEYLDIRTDLMDDIKEFSKQLVFYYLSCLKSLHVTEADTAYNNMKPIPVVYQRILFIVDFFTLSKIMNKVGDINLSDLIYIQNATKYVDSLSLKQILCKEIADHIE